MKKKVVSISSLYLIFLLALTSCKQQPPAQKNIDAWYKHIIIYNLDVKTFQDSDGDGEGDFKGLTSRLDYLISLGINTIWLAPFQPSPLKDDGYDVTDFYGIDPKLGTQQDLKNFISAAKAKHLKVIMDLVLNHTSDEHPWFKKAVADTTSPYHNWYVWERKRPDDYDKGMGFPGVEKETWRYNATAKEYFFHRFYRFQPDLNFQNPAVEKEAERILGYWLDQGMDGFRLDAVPFMIDDPRKSAAKPQFDFSVLHTLSGYVKFHKPGALLLGEANVEPEENIKYFGEHNNGLNMMFNFYANEYLFYAFASGDAELLKRGLENTRQKPGTAQWAWFLRNHDEVDLGRLSSEERKEAFKKFGPDTNMQLYKRGVRRRLATMLGDDPRRLRMAYSLLYSLPGTPVMHYGEELGMGEDLQLKERFAIRTPMQWDSSANGGFSTAKATFRPVINSVEYGYKKINVQAEGKDPNSLLNYVKRLITLRKECPEIDNGEWEIVDGGSDNVLIIKYNDNGRQLLMCSNFSDQPQQLSLETGGNEKQSFVSLLDPKISLHADDGRIRLKLPAYGYQWYRIK